MKRKITMALVLVMLLGLLAPQAALATTRYYLELTITETNAPYRTVTGTSGYLSIDSDSLTGAVVQVINSKYDKGDGALRTFASRAMKQVMDNGLSAYNNGRWSGWVAAYQADPTIVNANDAAVTVDLKNKLVDLTTTPDALTVGTLYQLSYTPANVSVGDPARGNTYVVSFTLKEYTTGETKLTPASPDETGVAKLLNTDEHKLFMIGDDKGMFRPGDSITRAEVAQMFYRLLRDQNVAITKTFADVKENAWYATAVGVLASSGIINGTSETTFEPARAITRAEFTAICTRFAKAASGSVSFTDVSVNHWAYGAISTAVRLGPRRRHGKVQPRCKDHACGGGRDRQPRAGETGRLCRDQGGRGQALPRRERELLGLYRYRGGDHGSRLPLRREPPERDVDKVS